MEYEKVESGEFLDNQKRSRYSIRTALLFFAFGIVCTVSGHWFFNRLDLNPDVQERLPEQNTVSDLQTNSPSVLKKRLSEIEFSISEVIFRLALIENSLEENEKQFEEQSKGEKQASSQLSEIIALTSSFKKRLQKLEDEKDQPNFDSSALLVIESIIVKADHLLIDKKNLGQSLEELKRAKVFVSLVSPSLRPTVSQLISVEVSQFEELYRKMTYEISEKLETLDSMVADLILKPQAPIEGKIESDSSREAMLSDWTLESIFRDIKNLVAITKVDHQLLNKFSADEGRLVKLYFLLETSAARHGLSVGDEKILKNSIENLNDLSEIYLSRATPISKLIDGLDVSITNDSSEIEKSFGKLLGKMQELRLYGRLLD